MERLGCHDGRGASCRSDGRSRRPTYHRGGHRNGPGAAGPSVCTLRRTLRLSQQDFAAHYRIPIGTLRDWEQGRKEPDAAARAYLHVIASEPDMVRKAIARRRPP